MKQAPMNSGKGITNQDKDLGSEQGQEDPGFRIRAGAALGAGAGGTLGQN